MNYKEAVEYLCSLSIYGSVPGLKSTGTLAFMLGNPQNELKFIHIAGTNGKGSISAMLSSVLSRAGLKVGTYTSPAVLDIRERFVIGGRKIGEKTFGEYVSLLRSAAEKMVEEGLTHPTVFEMETVLAFKLFADRGCDIVVLECGMGGLMDATNIVTTTIMEIFAHISLDHTDILGDTIEKITLEKAGILKPGSIAVSAAQSPEAAKVLTEEAAAKGIKLTIVSAGDCCLCGIKNGLQTIGYKKCKYDLSLIGSYQTDNGAAVIEAVNMLNETGALKNRKGEALTISPVALSRGLADTRWPGRFQLIRKNPDFIIDGAHNPDGAIRLRETIDRVYPKNRKIYIAGMFRDKDIRKVLGTVIEEGDTVFAVAAKGNPRALPPVELAAAALEFTQSATACDSVEEAVELALMLAAPGDTIIAFGSLAYLGQILEYMEVQGENRKFGA